MERRHRLAHDSKEPLPESSLTEALLADPETRGTPEGGHALLQDIVECMSARDAAVPSPFDDAVTALARMSSLIMTADHTNKVQQEEMRRLLREFSAGEGLQH